jgi:hypothetical protein
MTKKSKHKKAQKSPIVTIPKREIIKVPSAALRFSPYAWAKMLYMRDIGTTEVAGCIITRPNDLLAAIDFLLVKSTCSPGSFELDDDDLSNLWMDLGEAGWPIECFSRILGHTHPGMHPDPSGEDESTFQRCWGDTSWAVMFILADGGKCYAGLQYNKPPRHRAIIPVRVDYGLDFPSCDKKAWKEEYDRCIEKKTYTSQTRTLGPYHNQDHHNSRWDRWNDRWDDQWDDQWDDYGLESPHVG